MSHLFLNRQVKPPVSQQSCQQDQVIVEGFLETRILSQAVLLTWNSPSGTRSFWLCVSGNNEVLEEVQGKDGRIDPSKGHQQMKEGIRTRAAGRVRRHYGGLCDSIQCQDSQARINVRQLQRLGGSSITGILHHVMSSSTSSPNLPKGPGKPLLSTTKKEPSQGQRWNCRSSQEPASNPCYKVPSCQKMSRSRSHPAKSGGILEIGLEGVQMPSYSGQST
ncbi:hypothetical protein B9Z55_019739 [Caenorhabditis nigoni]|uniref:Uncharacterized protein n=1 Tax=Caenorhabditis nigoni TaxID=1611254 RepID=A0A2G5TJU5_9PELO|nr:hypothetical protein B9Z55_019739 [Caenorhabditis nigoni]